MLAWSQKLDYLLSMLEGEHELKKKKDLGSI